jgi:hypothetical protein
MRADRGGLKAAFTNFNQGDADKEAELKLLGRAIPADNATAVPGASVLTNSYQGATSYPAASEGLMPRPLLQREAVRQLSFRCPLSIAGELKRKAGFNQLEQQEILIEGLKRVLRELPDPPPGWEG